MMYDCDPKHFHVFGDTIFSKKFVWSSDKWRQTVNGWRLTVDDWQLVGILLVSTSITLTTKKYDLGSDERGAECYVSSRDLFDGELLLRNLGLFVLVRCQVSHPSPVLFIPPSELQPSEMSVSPSILPLTPSSHDQPCIVEHVHVRTLIMEATLP